MNEQDILNQAIELEKKGVSYYASQAAESKNQYARLFFERMVEEEEEHVEMLEGVLEQVHDGDDVEAELEEIPDSKVFPEDAKNIDGGYIDALEHALELEDKALEFYSDASERTRDKQLKKIYDYLVEFEQVHVKRLQKELNFIEGAGANSEI